ncbi:non-ribosomal peptide synthetase [Burkholderia gladioli]|uniref:non-ribosomal peptide synthetase n=1 Tax=Burkholderia gladioli TaxID=28095 RepID=UPI001ABB3098|nr:non-ribosomal peptide synthetase [Burkholderia gladioli]
MLAGDGALTADCAAHILAAGHSLEAILSSDERLRAWAARHGVPCAASAEALDAALATRGIDWLFTVDSEPALPAALLERVRRGRFAYRHAPPSSRADAAPHAIASALLARQTHHAAGWHAVDARGQAGPAAISCPVAIDAEDTTRSLTLKCEQAAKAGFVELLAALDRGTLPAFAESPHESPQQPRDDVPAAPGRLPAGAYLDWRDSAQALCTLVRALDFGEHRPNPLGCAKLLLGDGQSVRLSRIERLDRRSGLPAGSLVALREDGWQVASGSEDLLIGGFTTLEGEPRLPQALADEAGLSEGARLASLSEAQTSALLETRQALADREAFWAARLARRAALQLPFERAASHAAPQWTASRWQAWLADRASPPRTGELLALFAVYLARLTGESTLQLGWRAAHEPAALRTLGYLAPIVPIELSIDAAQTWSSVLSNVAAELAQLGRNPGFARDLVNRYPELRSPASANSADRWTIGLHLLDQDAEPDESTVDAGVAGTLLTLQVRADGAFRWIHDADRLDAEQIERMSTHLRELAQSLSDANGADMPVGQARLLPEAERALLLHEWNATSTPYPEDVCLHQQFEQQVERTPDAVALVFEEQTLSYAQLNARANQLAHELIALGVQPDSRVGICLQRSSAMVVGLLAILKAGGAYVPLDPAYPGERLAHILIDADPGIVLVDTTGRAALGQDALDGRRLLDPNAPLPERPTSNPVVPGLTSRHLAYVIYTSGSTGKPKGAQNEHRALVNRLDWMQRAYALDASDRVLQKTPFGFDVSVWEFFWTLLNGATLVVAAPGIQGDPEALIALIDRQRITTAHFVPSMLNIFLGTEGVQACTSLQRLVCSGEALPVAAIRRCQALLPAARIHNLYGPTEAAIDVTAWTCPPDYAGSTVPIGRPIANTRIYLLDEHGQPVPLGAVGELHIGGVGVARGYLNRPELTAERFVRDPFASDVEARMYRTGDLARYLPDGNIEYLGRNDFQVKIRGFRIELGEIEARLAEYPAVREAVVLALGEGADKRLVAYVVAEHDEQLIGAIRDHLAALLPDYMVPTAFVRLDALPLSPNGKLDRRALPAPDSSALARQVYEAPQGEIECALAEIWAELLGVERVGRHDSFFALGGHSLLAVRLTEQLRQRGLGLAVRDLFQTSDLSALARRLEQQRGQSREIQVPDNLITRETQAITPELLPLVSLTQPEIDHLVQQVPGGVSAIQDIYALSPLQDGILFHHLLATRGDPYLLIRQVAFASREHLDRYLDAVQQVIARHDILRTAFFWEGLSRPAQVVLREAPLILTELAFDPVDGPVAEQLARHFDPREHRIDLGQAPLLRFAAAPDEQGRWLLIELLHHLVGDHSTVEILHREVRAILAGSAARLLPAQPFRNAIAQARLGVSQQEHENFFRAMLADVDEPTLPFGLTEVHLDGSRLNEAHHTLPSSLNDRLRAQARRLGVSLASLCHLAWAQVLARASGQDRVVFGTVMFGRMQAGEGADQAMGLYINTLPLRMDLGETGVEQAVRDTHALLASLIDHEHASLALAQQCSGVPAGSPLFSALLNYVHSTVSVNEDDQAIGLEFLSVQERSNYPFSMSVEDFGHALVLIAQLVDPFDAKRLCAYFEQALVSVVEALDGRPSMPVRQLEILPPEERELLLHTWNATEQAYPAELCLHHQFELHAEHTPDAIALVFEDRAISYAQLNAQANRLAHELIALGVQPDARVALCVERSPALVIGLLAILKAGGAYLPLDPAYPPERLAYILADADPAIVLADAAGRAALGHAALDGRRLLDPDTLPERPASNPVVPGLTSRHLAYVIYTSGSTGKPKGVMVEHRGTLNLAQLQRQNFAILPSSRILQFASCAFDASVWEVVMALGCGATLYLPFTALLKDRAALLRYLAQHRITHATLPPALLQGDSAVLDPELALTLILAGEAPGPGLFQALAGHHVVFNAYGPTESTVCATLWRCPPGFTGETIPIGKPIANTRIYLLDAHGQPVPLGAVGELHIGGDGLARGYLNRPELTAERFLDDPFDPRPGARMYRSGDLARYLPDGNIVFLGRNDHQVKIRGFRIELGEIEARLAAHPAVREAVVLALGEGADKRLVAYVVAEHDEQLIGAIRDHLAAQLPDYMVPTAFVRLDALPLTPNGKLDRRALPAPDQSALFRQAYEAPQGEIESALAEIWATLLDIERVGRHDSFFALGGHSLLAVQLISRIAALGVELPLASLFASPTLAGLSSVIADRGHQGAIALPPITPLAREGELALSFSQQRLWFLAQLDGVSATYHMPLALRLQGRLDQAAWQRALDTLLDRHEALRSVFVTVQGQPRVRLLPVGTALPVTHHDLRGAADARQQLQAISSQEVHAGFDLEQGPLIRARLIRLSEDEHAFLLTQHHIVSDGWSLDVLLGELQALYHAYLHGRPDPLAPLAIQYPDYAAWQRQWLTGERLQAQVDYWRDTLADAPVLLDLPTDRPRPAQQSFVGAHVPVRFDAELTQALRRLAQTHGVTPYMIVMAAWAAVLARLSGQQDIVIGTPSANRNRQEVEPLIGFFVNTLALRLDLSGAPDAATLLARVRQAALAAQDHQDLPFEQVVEIVNPPRNLGHAPLFQVMFAWQSRQGASLDLPGLEATPLPLAYDAVNFDLELALEESGHDITGTLNYSTALFEQDTIERQLVYLRAMLLAMVRDEARAVDSFDILPPEERELLHTWNATEQAYPAELCLHHQFELHAEHTPDAIALVFEDRAISYAQLNAQANRLAHELIALGVQPDARVALCVERSPALVIGLLAILKAGGAYLPLDPAYPPERLAYILADADPAIVLADAAGRAALGHAALDGRRLLDPDTLPERPASNPVVPGLTSRHLAYVIYTSGSTGKPKGVMVEHRGTLNLAQLQRQNFAILPSSRILQFASCAFDASVWEVVMALGCGATLYLPFTALLKDRAALLRYLAQHRITHATLPPALLQGDSAVLDPELALTLILAGEAPGPGLFQALAGHHVVFNAYGPTESTVCATLWRCPPGFTGETIPIGKPIANTRIYLLDAHGQPVPLGAVGELHIGGDGLARGYLNRPELTAERFLDDPFDPRPGARMYRSGDLARYLPDGNIVFLGRNDHQVKIRGFRIELGEIEARLAAHPAVREAVVLALGEGADKRLVAYVVAEHDEQLIGAIRDHLAAQLPDYMVPTAFVRLDALPLTPNGKLDRRALPAPDQSALFRQAYEAPQGEIESALAEIWATLLDIERVGRHDSFFALGGHSLLAVQLTERLRQRGLSLAVRDLFQAPVLSALAQRLEQQRGQSREIQVPDNLITRDTEAITPELLPLISLTQPEIDHLVQQVPGGVSAIQDIYALSPLQDGILFHHLLATRGDPYLLILQVAFASREHLDRYLDAVQLVIARHDVLRTAFVWEGLSRPAQVVWRDAPLAFTELSLDPADGPVAEQLARRFDPREHRIDLGQAPLLRFAAARDEQGRWLLVELLHHLIGDHSTMEILHREVQAILAGRADQLSPPQPFRNLVAQAHLGVSQQEHEAFFRAMLADVEEPTLPFGLTEVHLDGSRVIEAQRMLPQALNDRLRAQARRLGVSLASLCHLAWAQVLARASGQDRVVFGTVLFGRMQGGAGADQAMGLFINTLPLRVDLDDTGVEQAVHDTHALLASLLDHEHASLALAQRCSGVPAGSPLFSALLNYRHNVVAVEQENAESGIDFLHGEERTNYPLTLAVEDFGNALGVTTQVVDRLDAERVGNYLVQALESLAEALDRTPALPVRQLEILPPEERALLLDAWNPGRDTPAEASCVHRHIERQAERTPDAAALVFEEQTLSYAQLNAQANQLAHELIALGVRPDSRVALCVERSIAMVVGLLAVLKAGGAYVPLDPAYPGERLAHILADADPDIVLVDAAGRAALGEAALAGRRQLDPNALPDRPATNPVVPGLTSRHLAYVIYTSGSTGTPKGVMVEHRGLANLMSWYLGEVGLGAEDTVLIVTSHNFDLTQKNLLGPLMVGGSLHLARPRFEPASILAQIRGEGIDHLNLSPSAFHALIDADTGHDLARLRRVVLGGEPIQAAKLAGIAAPRPVFVNSYGPTECSDVAGWHVLSPELETYHDAPVPLGKPIPHARIHLLDAHGRLVPLGVPGELCIGGVGVARGYLNRPELTAERFVRDPFASDVEARMYRTGDLARYLPDGNLEYLGRNDFQVKIRGFRIELGEIEARLAEYPAVREAVVLALGEGADKRLVAYVVAEHDEQLIGAIRDHLAALLPDYMVPTAFVRLDALPLSPNGKLDRRALPAPDSSALARQVYEAPQGEIECALAEIWAELLGVERVGRHDSFFALGGHSLLAVRLTEQLRQRGLGLAVRDLFQTSDLSALAQRLEQQRGQSREIQVPDNLITRETQAITPELLPLVSLTQPEIDHLVQQVPGGVSAIQDIYALSPLQDGILFHHLLATRGDPYLLIRQVAFASREHLDRYLDAVQQVIARHDILRTAFFWEGLSRPAQVVLREAPLILTELAFDPVDGPVAEQLARHFDPREHRIDLGQAPLLRFAAARDEQGRWLLIELLHHLVGDHSTTEILHREVQAILAQRTAQLPSPKPFRNLVAQAHLGVSRQEHETFFRAMLADVEEPTLPFGLTEVHLDGSRVIEAHRMLPQALNDRLRMQARRLGVSLASLCHLAWAQVLARASGQDRVVFGTVMFGRMQGGAGADQAMGLFINTLPLRMDLGETGVEQAVRHTHTLLASLIDHEHASLALAQQCSGVPAGSPLFSALLNYRHNVVAVDQENADSGIEFLHAEERTNYPLTLSVEDFGDSLGLTAQVVDTLDAARVNAYLAQALASLADALDETPALPVRQLEILPPEERALLLNNWNEAARRFASDRCSHQQFERQAERTPDAVALVFEEQTLSYAQLNARANRLAHELIALGVQPDTRIALSVERSPAIVIGLLAILKAGGAYVPLDPVYPGERLAHILADADPAIVLADAAGRAALGEAALAGRHVLDPNALPERPAGNPSVPGLASHHLAYVIYTSGSTGKPKGVMVEHRQVERLFDATAHWYRFDERDVWCLFHSFAFDFSVWEIWGALRHGGTLLIVPHPVARSPEAFHRLVCRHGVTVLNQTPSAFKTFIAAARQNPLPDRLRYVVFGGEALEPSILQSWYAGRDANPPQLVNMYGITETTVHVTYRALGPSDAQQGGSPIGRPIPDLRLYLLDAHRQPVPLGAVGELHVGGDGVARGYLNRPELNAERFLDDPFVGQADARMYRTGDLARYLPDGSLVFLGRNDHQVKIRGFRIELGEIEARLAAHPAVREAVVLALGEAADKRLVAYVVAGHDPLLAGALRDHLAAQLPDYMVPAAFVRLDALPLTPNGKLDSRALPAPDQAALASQAYEAPEGETECALAAIWAELLEVERVGRHDSFFALGGHSLLAVRLIEELRKAFGVKFHLATLYQQPLLAQLADALISLQIAQYADGDIEDLEQELGSLSDDDLLKILSAGT